MSDIYPLVIVKDRYHGTYSGGKWTAWNMCYVPSKIFADDNECIEFFSAPNLIFGKGETPEEAIDDLKMILDCGISDPDESTESEENSKLKKGDYMPSDIERLLNGIRRLEEKNEELKEQIKKLKQADMLDKEAADYWSKEYDTLLERFKKLRVKNEDLQGKYNLEKAANEAQHKFFREYAGKGTEIEFHCAVGDDEVTYVIVDKEEYKALKNCDCKIRLHGMDFTRDELVNRILELEKLKTPTIENFADEEPSTRADILDQAKKCVCGQREQDYGTPESNFQLIADLWNGYLGTKYRYVDDYKPINVAPLKPLDVSMMMALLKIARIKNGGGSGDSFVDLAGYAACGGEIWHGQNQKDQN